MNKSNDEVLELSNILSNKSEIKTPSIVGDNQELEAKIIAWLEKYESLLSKLLLL